jgi:hypothetical protein
MERKAMKWHRSNIAILLAMGVLAGSSCSSNETKTTVVNTVPGSDAGSTEGSSTAPGSTEGSNAGSNDAVIRLETLGGFVRPETLFNRVPTLLVSGDRRVFSPGVSTMEYPGKLVAPIMVRSMDPDTIGRMFEIFKAHKLLRTVTYATNPMIADAGDTSLTFTIDGTTYQHIAYALGFDNEKDADRAELAAAVNEVSALAAESATSAPDGESLFTPTNYQVRSLSEDMAGSPGDGIVPNEQTWPTGVARLSDATDCIDVAASAVEPLLPSATSITRFVEDGKKYVLAVRPVLPGMAKCP